MHVLPLSSAQSGKVEDDILSHVVPVFSNPSEQTLHVDPEEQISQSSGQAGIKMV